MSEAAAGSEAEKTKSPKSNPVAEAPNKIVNAVNVLYMTNERHKHAHHIGEDKGYRFCEPTLDLKQDAKLFAQALEDLCKNLEAHKVGNVDGIRSQLNTAMQVQLDNWKVGNVDKKSWDSSFDSVSKQIEKAKEALSTPESKDKDAEKKALDKLAQDLKDMQKKEYENALTHAARVLDLQARAKQQQLNEMLYFDYMHKYNGSLIRLDGDPNENAESADHANISYGNYKPYDKGFWSDGKSSIYIDENGARPTPPASIGSSEWTKGYTLALRTAFLRGKESDPIFLNYQRPDDVRFDELEKLLKIAFSIGAKVDLHGSKNLAAGLAMLQVDGPVSWFRVRKYGSPQQYFLKMIEEHNAAIDARIQVRQNEASYALRDAQQEQEAVSIKKQAEEIAKSVPDTPPEAIAKMKDNLDNLIEAVPVGAKSAKATLNALQDTVNKMSEHGKNALQGTVAGLEEWCVEKSSKITSKLATVESSLLKSTVTPGAEIPSAVSISPDVEASPVVADEMEHAAVLRDHASAVMPEPSAPDAMPDPSAPPVDAAMAAAVFIEPDLDAEPEAILRSAAEENDADMENKYNDAIELTGINVSMSEGSGSSPPAVPVNLSSSSNEELKELEELQIKIVQEKQSLIDDLSPGSAARNEAVASMNALNTLLQPTSLQIRAVESIIADTKAELSRLGISNDPQVQQYEDELARMKNHLEHKVVSPRLSS